MEHILRESRKYNAANNILPSENRVIDLLLGRSNEMQAVYDELGSKLTVDQQRHLWDGFLGAAVFWNPERSKDLRQTKRQLAQVNTDIAQTAQKLADFVSARREMCEHSEISAYDDYHFLLWVHRAGEGNHCYEGYVKEGLETLSGQFDLKYWPKNHEVIQAIADYASEAEIHETDPWTREMLSSPKHSNADYLRVILKVIEDKKTSGPFHYQLPKKFRLSDKSLATLINCTLDIPVEDLLSAENVKRSRQNIRGRSIEIG